VQTRIVAHVLHYNSVTNRSVWHQVDLWCHKSHLWHQVDIILQKVNDYISELAKTENIWQIFFVTRNQVHKHLISLAFQAHHANSRQCTTKSGLVFSWGTRGTSQTNFTVIWWIWSFGFPRYNAGMHMIKSLVRNTVNWSHLSIYHYKMLTSSMSSSCGWVTFC